MSKWFDANGVDVDAHPDRAFRGGVYEGGVFGKGWKPNNNAYPTESKKSGEDKQRSTPEDSEQSNKDS